MSNIKQIFLDLDGPLLDGKERHYFCYQSILRGFGFEPIGINEYWEKKRASGNRKDLLKMSNAEAIYDDFLAVWLALIESPEMLALDKVQDGAIDCLRVWKDQGIDLNLVTLRKDEHALEEQLGLLGLRQLLDVVLVCDHAFGGIGKADAVRKKYPGKSFRENTLWVGDTEADWEAATSLGCDVVLLSNGLRNEEYLKSLKGAVVALSITSLKDKITGN